MTETLARERSSGESDSSGSIPILQHSQSLDGRWAGNPPRIVSDVTIDSRECREGSLFVALEGTDTHGHQFLDDAIERGATAAIVEEEQPADIPQFVADDSRDTLQQLAVCHRNMLDDLFVIGVTGTCGKTTVKEMIAHLLAPKYETGKTPGNYNNELGLPLTILNESFGDVLVAELGMNAPGEIEQLTRWAQPSMGVITHIGPAHLENLGDVESVAREKGKLLEGLPDDGIAILPGWLEQFNRLKTMSSVAPRVTGRSAEADYPVKWKNTSPGVDLRVGTNEYELSFEGEHLVKDAAIAAVVALEMGVPEPVVAQRLTSFEPLEGRGQVLELGQAKLLDDGYNANPDSFRAALQRLASMPAPRLALVGDMKEMGKDAERYHRELGEQVSAIEDLDVYYVGEHRDSFEAGYEGNRLTVVDTVDSLPEINPTDYQSILVKASNAVGLNNVLERWVDQS